MSQSDLTPDPDSPPTIPRWVKIFAIIGIVVVLLVVIILITGIGGRHGPGRHLPSGNAIETPATGVTEDHAPFASVENGGQQPGP